MRRIAILGSAVLILLGLAGTADAGRYGSHRVGGHGSHGKGSHYVGGHKTSAIGRFVHRHL